MRSRVFPQAPRHRFVVRPFQDLTAHYKTLIRTPGGFVKTKTSPLTDTELDDQQLGDFQDISRFCCELPSKEPTGLSHLFNNSPQTHPGNPTPRRESFPTPSYTPPRYNRETIPIAHRGSPVPNNNNSQPLFNPHNSNDDRNSLSPPRHTDNAPASYSSH